MSAQQETNLVVVEYHDLLKSSFDENVMEAAFGETGVGIIGIQNIPGFVQAKADILKQAYPLAHLPAKELEDLEDPESLYNAGWSHGKEM
jgi:hypothetical protein